MSRPICRSCKISVTDVYYPIDDGVLCDVCWRLFKLDLLPARETFWRRLMRVFS